MRPTAALRGDMSRGEAAVRRITQEWVLACNTRHLDDLLELYVSDALVLRSNYPPIRGAAAVASSSSALWTRAWGSGGRALCESTSSAILPMKRDDARR